MTFMLVQGPNLDVDITVAPDMILQVDFSQMEYVKSLFLGRLTRYHHVQYLK